jgi:membrane protease YdiL (CAAX protease family)
MDDDVARTADGRLRAPLRLLAHLLALAVLVTLLTGGARVVLSAVGREGLLAGGTEGLTPLGTTLQAVATLGATAWALRSLDRRPAAGLGLAVDATWLRDAAVGAGVAVGVTGGAVATAVAAGWATLDATAAVPAAALAGGLATMLAVGVYEEVLVRGYWLTNAAEGLTGRLSDAWATRGAVGGTAAAFGVGHAANPSATVASTLTIAVAGVVLGLAYVRSGSLALPVGFHVGWNAALAHLWGLPVSGAEFGPSVLAVAVDGPRALTGGPFGPEGGLLGLAWLLLGGAAMLAWADRTGDGVRGVGRLRTGGDDDAASGTAATDEAST